MTDFWNDIKEAEVSYPVIPEGEYNGIITGYEMDEVGEQNKAICRLTIVLQNNPGRFLSDNSAPVDGQSVEYTIWFPTEEDKQTPARYGRGTMYDITVRRIRKFFDSVGINPSDYASMDEAFEASKNAKVVVSIGNRSLDDGSITDYVKKVS